MNNFYIPTDELYHHGVLGQKWGVRRYQNYDGTYTKKGLARVQAAESTLNDAKALRKAAKDSYRKGSGNYKGTKIAATDKNAAKSMYKDSKRVMKEAKQQYKAEKTQLKKDYKADKGKELYAKGYRITGKEQVMDFLAEVGSLTVAVGVAGKTGKINALPIPQTAKNFVSSHSNLLIGIGTGVAAAGGIGKVATRSLDNNLREYYSHSAPKTQVKTVNDLVSSGSNKATIPVSKQTNTSTASVPKSGSSSGSSKQSGSNSKSDEGFNKWLKESGYGDTFDTSDKTTLQLLTDYYNEKVKGK